MNSVPNPSFGVCTAWALKRVGNPIAITDWYSVVPGVVGFHSLQAQSGHCEGLIPGKLMLVEGPGTQNVNGLPAGGDPWEASVIGYPLRVVQAVTGTLVATLAGAVSDPGPSNAATAWEVAPGVEALDNGDGPDGWKKSITLQAWRQFLCDADLNPSVRPGSKYSIKLRKNSSNCEYFYTEFDDASCEQFRGKTIAFGGYAKPASGTCRPYIFDGAWHFGSYFPQGAYTWQELSITVNPAAPVLQSGYEIGGTTNDVSWVAQPRQDYGTLLGDWQPSRGLMPFRTHPNFNRNYINNTLSGGRVIRLEQESLGKLPEGLKAIHVGIEATNDLAYQWLVLSNLQDMSNPSLTMYSNVAGNRIVNSGLATVGRYAEPYSGLKSDAFWIAGQSPWRELNIDMIACEM